MDELLNLAPCFVYVDQNGDTITKSTITNYVTSIGTKVCTLVGQTNANSNSIVTLSDKTALLKQTLDNIQPYVLPSLFPTGIAPIQTAIRLDNFTALLEQKFVQLQSLTGTPNDIAEAMASQLANDLPAVGTNGGLLSSLPGWQNSPVNLADVISNISISIADIRSSIRNISLNILSECEGIAINMQSSYASKTLQLIFTGTLPATLVNQDSGGSMFTVKDNSGNFLQKRIDVAQNLNQGSGVTIDLSSSSINFNDNLIIESIYGFKNPLTGTVCQKQLSGEVSNATPCPTVSITEAANAIDVQFISLPGSAVYYIEIYDAANVLIQNQSKNISSVTTVNSSFNGLISSTAYKLRLRIVTATTTKLCAFLPFSTLPSPCASPSAVSASFQLL